jgi:glycosyltransferase involved in cell wall biosynthesis
MKLIKGSIAEWKRFTRSFKGIREAQRNLFLYTPPLAFPGGDWIPWINNINQFILQLCIKLIALLMGIKKPILWIFSYTGGDLIGKFKEKISIYYCNDPFGEFAGEERRRAGIINIEKELVKKADLVFAVSDRLVEEKKCYNFNTFLSEHAVPGEYLVSLNGWEDRVDVPHPRIGYVGTYNRNIDYALLEYMVRSRPDWNLVLVGPIAEVEMDKESEKRFKILLGMPNVHYLGGKRKEELPYYYNSMDVFLFPYINRKLDEYINIPLKFFEYLTFGKPIVSINNYSGFKKYNEEFIKIARTKEEYVAFIEDALSENNEENMKKRFAAAKNNAWENRVEAISDKIGGHLKVRINAYEQ